MGAIGPGCVYLPLLRANEPGGVRHADEAHCGAGACPRRVLRRLTLPLITFAAAINEALSTAMAQDPNLICYGRGIDDPKGVLGTTLGLKERFGPQQVGRSFSVPKHGTNVRRSTASCPLPPADCQLQTANC